MDTHEYIQSIRTSGDRFVAVLEGVDLEAPVPSCPEWVVRDLVRHQAGVHAWARTIVGQRLQKSPDRDMEQLVGGWPVDSELLWWFQAGYESLADVLEQAPEQLRCWTFLEAASPLVHWARRQAHETAIHRVDAELSAGQRPVAFDPGFASDGIDELLTAFITRPNRGPRSEHPTSFSVQCTDSGAGWTVYYDGEKAVTERYTDPDADALVRGSASDLYLWVWHRLPQEQAELVGDLAVIADWNQVQVRWS
ncbi:MAG: maleylpyruvate isomerase family mycothiol-dependent enzyme [Acidimicrobiia bacterium]|nr:maleylpyruvate isomerase family mycothiol-dependent enzyme [Acidimicrobiia bacterium]MDH5422920.1 maleylpyruvate isomerase family mycothiol-dependent enzyme [Acidimicrobiia bacterium]MDH5504539.1 maleylpyruvate isomerase family mycothiol-dependent enzyme [Acidimicrobiia bacterium]